MASKKQADSTIQVVVEGKPYELDLADVTGVEARAYREATGYSLQGSIVAYEQGKFDELEFVAGIVWLVRNKKENVTYETVLGSLTRASIMDQTPKKESDPPA